MDWPLTGAITGVVVLAGGVIAGAVALIGYSGPAPVKKNPTFVLILPLIDNPIYSPESLPVIPEMDQPAATAPPPPGRPAPAPDRKKPGGQRPATDQYASHPSGPDQKKATPAPSVPSAPKQAPQTAPDHWRVVTTSKAGYMNLGGHVDRAGVVDSLATGHLRDAFKKHRNFDKLPTHQGTYPQYTKYRPGEDRAMAGPAWNR